MEPHHDERWLEGRGVAYLARWEASRERLAAHLARCVARQCERTGEAPDALLEAIPEIVERLAERGVVDDRRYAAMVTRNARRAGRSAAWIERRLASSGVSPDVGEEAERALADELGDPESAELAAAFRTARRRRLGPFCPDPAQRREDRERHLAVLARGGFSCEIATRVVDAEPDGSARPAARRQTAGGER